MVESDITLLYIVGAYFFVMLVIGAWAYSSTDSAEDFLLAGRSLGALVIAGTLMATWMGSGTVTGGQNSIAYSYGIWPAMLYGLGPLVGIAVLSIFASRIRGYNKYTIPEVLEVGIGREARLIGLAVISVAYVGIVSYQFTGFGFVLHVTTGLPVQTGTLVAAGMIITLAAAGGLMSVAYTDAISAFLIVIGLLLSLPFVLSSAGGWEEITASVPESHLSTLGGLTVLEYLGYWAPTLLLILADQNMYQRIVAGRSTEDTGLGIVGWFVGVAVAGVVVPFIAFAARAMFPNLDPGMALISTATVVPTWVGGILLASASAFIITTGSSFLLSSSTNISRDLYKGFIHPDASDRQIFWLTRVIVVIFGVFAYVLGQYFPTILSLQIYAYTAYGATITPALFAVFLFRDRLTRIGGVLGMLAGFSATIGWETVLGKPFGLNAVLVSAPLAAIVIIGASYITGWQDGTVGVTDSGTSSKD